MTRERVMQIYLAAFMLVMAFLAYMCFTQPILTERPAIQDELRSDVPSAIINGEVMEAAPVDKGDALVTMEIPRFGKDWFWTVLEGTDMEVLANGPGHFIGTPLPGEKGNSAYAAHRSSHGDPFLDFDKLREGDDVIIRQGKATWVYEITSEPQIIDPDDSWVLDRFAPGRWITLTTCWPKYGSEKRMFVRARLDNA